MDIILHGLTGIRRYMDDILVYGITDTEHDENLKKLLERLKVYNIDFNGKKSIFNVTELQFLGYHISINGIQQTDDRVLAIKNLKQPKSKEELQSVIGLFTYVTRFVPNLATLSEPLRRLMVQQSQFRWTEDQQTAFDVIKKAIGRNETLGYFNPKDRTELLADASPVGLGAMLQQVDANGTKRIIGYASKSLTTTERKYYQTEREALAIVWAIEKFHLYLFGIKFFIYTDCKALEFMTKPRAKPCLRIERWLLRIQAYDFEVIHFKGKDNVADALSRLMEHDGEEEDAGQEEHLIHQVRSLVPSAMSPKLIEEKTVEDPELEAVKEAMAKDNWDGVSEKFRKHKEEFCQVGEILLRGSRIVIPKDLRDQVIDIAHTGHPGIVAMKTRLRSKVWFPEMDSFASNRVKSCLGCVATSAANPPDPMGIREMPVGPWQDIAIDFKDVPDGGKLLVAIDYFSRFVTMKELSITNTAETILALKQFFQTFGLPTSITLDNGPPFNGEEFKEWAKNEGILLRHSPPLHPAANGLVERFNRNIQEILQISFIEGTDWRNDLADYVQSYHNLPHSTTGESPAQLMFQRELRDKLPCIPIDKPKLIHEEVRERDLDAKLKRKAYVDNKRHAKKNSVNVGDSVIMKNHFRPNKITPPFGPRKLVVTNKKGSEVVIQDPESGRNFRRVAADVKVIPPRQLNSKKGGEVARRTSSRNPKPNTKYDDFVRD